MIESIGYTDDGQVWVRLIMEINGERMGGTLMLKPAFARDVSRSLANASDQAEKAIGVNDERNGTDPH